MNSKQSFPRAKVSGGISNLSFAFRGNERVRAAMNSVFLYHAVRAGLDMAIVNAGQLTIYDEIPPELRECVEDVVLNRRPDATERLMAMAQETSGQANTKRGRDRVARTECARTTPLRHFERHHRSHRRRRRGSSVALPTSY